jgi:hypothetical protein
MGEGAGVRLIAGEAMAEAPQPLSVMARSTAAEATRPAKRLPGWRVLVVMARPLPVGESSCLPNIRFDR